MATQTVLSEEVEKEEVKNMEAEKVCPTTKESVEKVTKPEATVTQQDDEKPKEVSSEQKPVDEPVVELPPPAELEKVEDKPVELPPTIDEKKTEDAPIVDKATPQEAVPAPDDTAEPNIEKEDIKSEATCVEPIEEKTKPEEIEKVVDVPVSLPAGEIEKVVDEPVSSPAEEIATLADELVSTPAEEMKKVADEPVLSPAEEEKDETPKESPAKAVEPIENKDDIVAEGECKPQEAVSVAAEEKIPEKIEEETPKIPADEVLDAKLAEKEETCAIEAKSEATAIQVDEKHVDSNPIDQEKDTSVAAAPVVEEKILEKTPELPADEVEGTKLPCAIESSEASGIQVEEKHVDSNPIVEATEQAKDTVEVTGESGVEPGKNETVVAEEKSVVAEELVPCEEKEAEDAKGSVPVAENATSRDIDLACDKGSNEDETTKNVDEKIEQTVEAKLDQVDEKIAEDKEEEKQVNEPEKTECIKDSEETKTYEDVPVKKQSFVKIMKQSLVKAKKAIIGKSQNPKTPASEPKADCDK